MSTLLALLDGVILAVMIMINGVLADTCGNYTATVFIHLTGLLAIILVLVIKKEKWTASEKHPWYLYSGGAVGVATVVFNNLTYSHLGVAVTLALGLFGQTVFSLIIDQWGLFGAKVVKLQKGKWIGLSLIITGIIVMQSK